MDEAAVLGWWGPQVGGLLGGYEAYRSGCLYWVGEALVQMQWDQAALGIQSHLAHCTWLGLVALIDQRASKWHHQ